MLAADRSHTACCSAFTDATTSAGVTAENSRNTQPTGAGVKDGAYTSAVAARTPATLLSKKLCRSDALISVDGGTRPWPSGSSKDRHRRPGCDCLLGVDRVDQNAERFWPNNSKYWRHRTRHALTAGKSMFDSGPARRAAFSEAHSGRLALRQSSSNQVDVGRRRQVMSWTGTWWSSSSLIVLS